MQYTTTIGRQKTEMNEHEVTRGASFTGEKTRTQTLKHAQTSQIKYDLIGKIAEGTVLTRKTVAAILKGLRADKLYMFKNNPEEFISKVVKLIKEQKATMIVEHISYDQLEGGYDSTIFTAEKSSQTFDKAFHANKAIQDYVFTDGSAERALSVVLLKIWMLRRKFVFMQSCRRASIFLLRSATTLLTGRLLFMREL